MKKEILAGQLTELQKEKFTCQFYGLWERKFEFLNDFDDLAVEDRSDYPWGMPWDWNPTYVLVGETIEEMVKNFFNENEKEILQLAKEAENN